MHWSHVLYLPRHQTTFIRDLDYMDGQDMCIGVFGSLLGLWAYYAAHRNITGDSSSIFAAVLKGEQTFVFVPVLELSQNTEKAGYYYSWKR